MISDKLINFKFKLLQNKTQRFNKENIKKLKSYPELTLALKKKYPIFFDIIDKQGIQYKQFLSAFFGCILTGNYEPFSIRIEKGKEYNENVYNKYSANYNYITLLPWNKYNIIKCYNSAKREIIRINKEQFMQSVIVLFPKFIKRYPKLFLSLNNKLKNIDKKTISVIHLYKYLVYCGDKLSKDEYYDKSIKYKNMKFTKNKIETFLRILTYDQFINILIN